VLFTDSLRWLVFIFMHLCVDFQLENKLVPHQSSESGQLTDREHKDALDNIVPLCNERMRKRLFLEAEKAVIQDGVLNAVPIMRLARILELFC
jgi:hypothetical protein